LFELGEGAFNGIEIWGIRGQKCKNNACICTDLLQCLPLDAMEIGEYSTLVNPSIIHNKDRSRPWKWRCLWDHPCLDKFIKYIDIVWPFDDISDYETVDSIQEEYTPLLSML